MTQAGPILTGTTVPATHAPTTAPATLAPAAKGYPGSLVYEEIGKKPDGVNTIYLADPNGKGRTKLGEGRSPLLSPDGRQVAYLVALPTDEPFGKVAIRIANIDGSGKTEDVCTGAGNAVITLVRWSPRNRAIAISATQNGGPGSVYQCNLTTKTLEIPAATASPDVDAPYDWTPTGENTVWQTGVYTQNPTPTILYGDPDKGATAVVVTDDTYALEANGEHYYTAARISQSGHTIALAGKKIVFVSVPGQTSDIAGKTLTIDGTPERIAWSPDGGAVAVSFTNESGAYLSIFDLETGKQTTLGSNIILGDWSRQ